MHTGTIAVVLVMVAMGSTVALAENPEEEAAMKTVGQFVGGFNKADGKATLAACARQTSIIDEFPPHSWQTCSSWLSDYNAWGKKNGVTDGVVTLADPKHVDITGNFAYVIVPTTFTFKQNGKQMKEEGSTLTVVLQKGAAGWQITAWTWTMGS